jgi:3-oxoacyl-[acyl-carrier protein] reductase
VLPLDGRTALVTGGSRGIGRAIVHRLVEDGADVYFTYHSRLDEADALTSEITARNGKALAGQLDIGSPDDIRQTFDAADSSLDGLDIVVHNACTATLRGSIAEVTDADYDYMIDGNLRGGFTVLQEASRRVRDGGRIINISSLDTAKASAGSGVYAAAKAAVEQLSAAAAQELGARRVTVNTVSPGAVDTTRLREDRTPEELAGAAAATPLGRLGHPEDIARVVAFLAGPDGGWITGQNLRAGGGIL